MYTGGLKSKKRRLIHKFRTGFFGVTGFLVSNPHPQLWFTSYLVQIQLYTVKPRYNAGRGRKNFVAKNRVGGGCNPKKTEKNRKKPVPNLKFAVAFGFFGFFRFFRFFFRFFSVFFGFFSVFCGTFSVFFRSELRQEIPVIQKSCQQ